MKFIRPMAIIMMVNFLSVNIAVAVDDPLFDCAEPTYQMEMNHCSHQDYLAADVDLNKEYKRAKAVMVETDGYLPQDLAGGAKSLLNAQRAWIKYRDFACETEGYQYFGGTIAPLIVSRCLERLTRVRIMSLVRLSELN